MHGDINPYEASAAESAVRLTMRQRLLAVFVGILVVLASGVTMTAFLFGVLLAAEGQSLPSPISVSALFAGTLRPWSILGGACIVGIPVWLGSWSMFRILKVQRCLMEASAKRRVLVTKVEAMRQSHAAGV